MNEEEKQILEERYPRAIDYIDYLKEEIRKLQNKLEIEKKKTISQNTLKKYLMLSQ